MKKAFHILISILCSGIISGQTNLIPNPSFEIITGCPSGASQLTLSAPWFEPGTGTPDLFHICSSNADVTIPTNLLGHQSARTGSAYAGFFTLAGDYREYIEVPLSTTLTSGTKYFFTIYVSSSDTFSYESSAIGAHFSSGIVSVNHYSPIPVVPQIQNQVNNNFNCVTWKKFSGSFTAAGNEDHLTIGNFNTTIGSPSTAINPTVWPYNTCCTYMYVDDLCLSTDSMYAENGNVGIKEIGTTNLNIFPNPANSILTIDNKKNELYKLSLRDIYGTELYTYSITGSVNIDLSTFKEGIYFLHIRQENSLVIKKVVVRH